MKSKIILITLCSIAITEARGESRPNIVFFLVDDMGWRDLGCFGARLYETPHIDKLCAEGMRFTSAYTSAPISSPARASVLSGQHPMSLSMWNHKHYVPSDVRLLPSYLKDVDYTTWHVGKWHIGNPEDKTMPTDVGFDVNIGGGISWSPGTYFWPYRTNADGTPQNARASVPSLYSGGKKGEFITDRLTDEAVRLIRGKSDTSPLFLNMWYYTVHTVAGKHEAKPELVAKYEAKIKQMGITPTSRYDSATGMELVTSESNATYAAMIESLDDSVGRIVEEIKAQGLYDNTIFIFTSDNGSVTNSVPCVPLMGGKNSTYEAGVRVPAFITWNGHVEQNTTSEHPIVIMDIFNTIIDVAGVILEENHPSEGKTLTPLLTGNEMASRDLYWYFPDSRPHWGGRASMAYFDGESQAKYIHFFTNDPAEMYNIKEDIAEERNIVAQEPQLAREIECKMRERLRNHYKSLPAPPQNFKESILDFIE